MQQIQEEKSSNGLAYMTVFFMISSAVLSYLMFELHFDKVSLSKTNFICTKIEQVGKHMDDVICTQYTHQKFSKEAVALNQMVK